MFRIGIIGAGHIAEKMATTLHGMDGVEAYAVASRQLERAQEFASRRDFRKAYGSYEALADDPEVDLIYSDSPLPALPACEDVPGKRKAGAVRKGLYGQRT